MQGQSISIYALITITANILALSTAIGLLFAVLVQPRRERLNWYFAAFLGGLGLWAYASLGRLVPGMGLLNETHSFYLVITAFSFLPTAFFLFIISFTRLDSSLIKLVTLGAVFLAVVVTLLLWGGQVVIYYGRAEGGPRSTILPAGYFGLASAVLCLLLAFVLMRKVPNEHTRALQVPTLLLIFGYVYSFVAPTVRLPLDTLAPTLAAILIGYAVLRYQLFNPLTQTNEQLQATNRELRRTVEELEAEKARAEKLNEELRAANRYKNEFLANMSHELRTPLNSIVGYSELLMQGVYGPLNEKQQDRLEKVHRNGRGLLALISDILDLSKIEAGRLELAPQRLQLRDVLDEPVTAVEPLMQSKNLALIVEIAEDLRPLYADPVRLRQILINLLSNAAKFTREGSVTFAAQNIEVEKGLSAQFNLPLKGWLKDGPWVLIRVTDTGIGIAPENQAVIFEEFRQVDGTATREYGGTGLGLAITRKLVELHDGRIWVQSAVDSGSTFFVVLPAADVLVKEQAAVLTSGNGKTDYHILIIDDNPEAADILSVYLTEAGCRVTRALDGPTGIRLAHELRPCLITTDILMPGMTGWEVIDRLKADPETADIPVIIVSIVDKQPVNVTLGAAAHLSKPVDRETLLRTVRRFSQRTQQNPILIVDDNPADQEIIGEILRSDGYSFESCEGGEQAIQWLGKRAANLVLLDLMMPRVSGFDVLSYIRQTPALSGLPVIVVSAKELNAEEKVLLQGRIADLVKKEGLDRNDLLARIQRALA